VRTDGTVLAVSNDHSAVTEVWTDIYGIHRSAIDPDRFPAFHGRCILRDNHPHLIQSRIGFGTRRQVVGTEYFPFFCHSFGQFFR
jgi:hypothetical protein